MTLLVDLISASPTMDWSRKARKTIATTNTQKKSSGTQGARKSRGNGSAERKATPRAASTRTSSQRPRQGRRQRYAQNLSEVPTWLAAVMSVVGAGVAIGAGLYATRAQWLPKAREWRDDFNAAYADDETDYENFDQTRHAGKDSMRDNPGDDWEDIDDMSDASFPASDPPSFNPGTA